MLHRSIKAGRESSKADSNLRCSDTCLPFSTTYEKCKDSVPAITVSSFSSMYTAAPGPEEEGMVSGPAMLCCRLGKSVY